MVYIRRLSIEEKIERVRCHYDARTARHNAGIVERLDLAPKPALRDQVLDEFGGADQALGEGRVMGSLVDAALLDQERRILAANPLDVVGRHRRRATRPFSSRQVRCTGGCERRRYRSELRGKSNYTCRDCRARSGEEG